MLPRLKCSIFFELDSLAPARSGIQAKTVSLGTPSIYGRKEVKTVSNAIAGRDINTAQWVRASGRAWNRKRRGIASPTTTARKTRKLLSTVEKLMAHVSSETTRSIVESTASCWWVPLPSQSVVTMQTMVAMGNNTKEIEKRMVW
jgi:hypothetical protein